MNIRSVRIVMAAMLLVSAMTNAGQVRQRHVPGSNEFLRLLGRPWAGEPGNLECIEDFVRRQPHFCNEQGIIQVFGFHLLRGGARGAQCKQLLKFFLQLDDRWFMLHDNYDWTQPNNRHMGRTAAFKVGLAEVWGIVEQEAKNAIDNKDLVLLRRMIDQTPSLVNPSLLIRPHRYKTLLHHVVHKISQENDLASLNTYALIFQELDRRGADPLEEDENGQSVFQILGKNNENELRCHIQIIVTRNRESSRLSKGFIFAGVAAFVVSILLLITKDKTDQVSDSSDQLPTEEHTDLVT